MVEIKKIVDKNSADAEKICFWFHEWWGKNEGFSMEKMRAYVHNSLQSERLPQTFGIYLEDELVGTYQFSMHDCDVRPELYPWLINVFISYEFRNRGILHEIMDSVIQNAKNLNFDKLYLYTYHVGLYEKFGWKFVEKFKTYITENDYQNLYVIDFEK